jgi:hypothetical protein
MSRAKSALKKAPVEFVCACCGEKRTRGSMQPWKLRERDDMRKICTFCRRQTEQLNMSASRLSWFFSQKPKGEA